MSETIPTRVDANHLIKVHQANYAVFQARTEKEVLQAIQKVLQASHYVNFYYTVNDQGLEQTLSYNSATKKVVKGTAGLVELSPAEIEWNMATFRKRNFPQH
jgi:hypothetical protein